MIDFDSQHEEEVWGKIFSKELKKKIFNKFTSYWWEDYYAEITNFVLGKLGNFSNINILEAGAGSGKASILIGDKVEKITLLDISENALSYAKFLSEKLNVDNIDFIKGNIFNLPFKNDIFDLTWNIGVLEHYDIQKIFLILEQMVGVTMNGGYVAFGIPNFFSGPTLKAWLLTKMPFRWIPGYKLDTEKFYSEKEIRDVVNKLCVDGINIIDLEINYFGSFLPMETPKFMIRLFNRISSKMFKHNKFLMFVSFKVIK